MLTAAVGGVALAARGDCGGCGPTMRDVLTASLSAARSSQTSIYLPDGTCGWPGKRRFATARDLLQSPAYRARLSFGVLAGGPSDG